MRSVSATNSDQSAIGSTGCNSSLSTLIAEQSSNKSNINETKAHRMVKLLDINKKIFNFNLLIIYELMHRPLPLLQISHSKPVCECDS